MAQAIAVAAGGVEPVGRLLHRIYATGLRTVLDRLIRHEAVHSIYGCGSFFDGGCLYGHSDIDLIIVLKPEITRGQGVQSEIGLTYKRVRRWFPFLGKWDEKAASLVFLDEVETGFPVLESFRVRMKQGRLVRLHGPAFPIDLGGSPLTIGELAAECGAIQRTAILTQGAQAWNSLFWHRLFGKLGALAEGAGLTAVADAIAAESRRQFGTLDDRRLFFRRSNPRVCGSTIVRLAAELTAAAGGAQPAAALRSAGAFDASARVSAPERDTRMRALLRAARVDDQSFRLVGSVPIGLTPHLFYFAPGTPMPYVEIEHDGFEGLRRLVGAMKRIGMNGETLLVRVQGTLFIVTRRETFADLVPLDAQVHANLYAWVDGRADCTMARPLHDEQCAESRQCFAALAAMYRRHEDWVPKVPGPGVYREDDLDTLNNAFSMLRTWAAIADPPIYLMTPADIAAHYARRHPEAAAVLALLLEDLRYHRGEIPERPAAPNLFRCLHQFMFQLMTGASAIVLDDPNRGLAITVGIITRNRCADLREALASLEGLRRSPDEVVVVDNGSTDDTRAVIESFADRLPIKYVLVPEPGIPGARNAVLTHASHEVIAFTDDDCAVGREWLTAVERGFMRARNVGIVGGWVLHWPAPEPSTVDTYFGFFHHNKA